MNCMMCGSDLSKIEVIISTETTRVSSFRANDLSCEIKDLSHDLGSTHNCIESAKCISCGNKFDSDELEELSKTINVSY